MSELCKNVKAENKKLYFSLTCDEMAIRKLIGFDGKQWHEHVNIAGDINESGNNMEATNALVFMLVGINSYFKIVIAYYLVHILTDKEKSYILNDILHVAHSYVIPIRNVTFDGSSTNISIIEKTGSQNFNISR